MTDAWYNDHYKRLELATHLVNTGMLQTPESVIYFFEKPWKYEKEWQAFCAIFDKKEGPKITGMLAIGNGEKCPFCDVINDPETIDITDHLLNEHPQEFEKALFGNKEEKKPQ